MNAYYVNLEKERNRLKRLVIGVFSKNYYYDMKLIKKRTLFHVF